MCLFRPKSAFTACVLLPWTATEPKFSVEGLIRSSRVAAVAVPLSVITDDFLPVA